MSIALSIIAILAAYPLGSLVDWLLESSFPKDPQKKHIIAGLSAILFLTILVILPLFFSSDFSTTNPQTTPAIPPNFSSWWDVVATSDKVFLTGFITISVIFGLIYLGYEGEKKQKYLPLGFSVFASTLLLWIYFRLWLGENWWIYICVAPIIIVLFIWSLKSNNGEMTNYKGREQHNPNATDQKEPLVSIVVPTVNAATLPQTCAYCRGKGSLGVSRCPSCNGKGSVLVILNSPQCAYCRGKGSLGVNVCPACNGTGWAHVVSS